MSRIISALGVFIVSAGAALAQTITPAPVAVFTTAMTGVAEGQVARLNVLNPGVVPPATGVVCTATLSFLDSNGKVLKTTTVSVAPGTAAPPFDLAADADLGIPAGTREEIRATIAIPGIVPVAAASSDATAGACKLIPTLEIFDSLTRRTQSQLGGVHEVPSAPVSTN